MRHHGNRATTQPTGSRTSPADEASRRSRPRRRAAEMRRSSWPDQFGHIGAMRPDRRIDATGPDTTGLPVGLGRKAQASFRQVGTAYDLPAPESVPGGQPSYLRSGVIAPRYRRCPDMGPIAGPIQCRMPRRAGTGNGYGGKSRDGLAQPNGRARTRPSRSGFRSAPSSGEEAQKPASAESRAREQRPEMTRSCRLWRSFRQAGRLGPEPDREHPRRFSASVSSGQTRACAGGAPGSPRHGPLTGHRSREG